MSRYHLNRIRSEADAKFSFFLSKVNATIQLGRLLFAVIILLSSCSKPKSFFIYVSKIIRHLYHELYTTHISNSIKLPLSADKTLSSFSIFLIFSSIFLCKFSDPKL